MCAARGAACLFWKRESLDACVADTVGFMRVGGVQNRVLSFKSHSVKHLGTLLFLQCLRLCDKPKPDRFAVFLERRMSKAGTAPALSMAVALCHFDTQWKGLHRPWDL